MSHYAKVFNSQVLAVIVATPEFINQLSDADLWIQTSYRTQGNTHPEGTPLRGNFAQLGGHYNSALDVFYAPQPFPSWRLCTQTWCWQPPVPVPDSEHLWFWSEPDQSWHPAPE